MLSLGANAERIPEADWVAVGDTYAAQVQAAVLHVKRILHRVSEMLEVMDKADRLHVEEPMRRSMGEASTSGASSIRFNEVLLCSAISWPLCDVLTVTATPLACPASRLTR